MREKHPDGESACGYCLAGKHSNLNEFQASQHRKANCDIMLHLTFMLDL